MNEKPFQKGDLVRVIGASITGLVIETTEQFNARMRIEQRRIVIVYPSGHQMSVVMQDFDKLMVVRESTYYGDLKAGRISTTEDWWKVHKWQ